MCEASSPIVTVAVLIVRELPGAGAALVVCTVNIPSESDLFWTLRLAVKLRT